MRRVATGGCVSVVEAHSLGARVGVRPGDVILSVNGHTLRDVIDFRFHTAEPMLEMTVDRAGMPFTLSTERRFGEAIGIEFAHPTFDVDIRRCANHCEFCFVTQTPRGMRSGLYVKDDDYRYSFLFGQFVTLTNLDDDDWQRIAAQHLSPLYVSVHATEPELRGRLLGRRGASDIHSRLRWLIEHDIQVHTQLVLVPGQNDGVHLARSLDDLMGLHPGVQSVSVVPVGLTRYHAPGLRPYRPDEARSLLDEIDPWRTRCRRQLGVTLVYPSDEWYLLSGRSVPPAVEYDGFGQLDNGVGLVRQFLDAWEATRGELARGSCASSTRRAHDGGWRRRRHRLPEAVRGCLAVMVSGELAAPILEQVADELNELTGARLTVRRVVNQWYGGGVTVAGLLTGRDIVAQLTETPLTAEIVFLPKVMFDAAGRITLDDMTPEAIQAAIGKPVVLAGSMREVVAALTAG